MERLLEIIDSFEAITRIDVEVRLVKEYSGSKRYVDFIFTNYHTIIKDGKVFPTKYKYSTAVSDWKVVPDQELYLNHIFRTAATELGVEL